MGFDEVTINVIDDGFTRVVVGSRNFGRVQAAGAVARISVVIDGKPMQHTSTVAETENIGIVSQTVPYRLRRFVQNNLYEAARSGRSRLVVRVEFNYQGPDQRLFLQQQIVHL
jgi:hypothetical protein